MKRLILALFLVPTIAWAPGIDDVPSLGVSYGACIENVCWPRVSRCLDNPKGRERIIEYCARTVFRPCRYVCWWNYRTDRIRDEHERY